MDSVNVLVVSAIGEDCLRKIAAVSPNVRVYDASNSLAQDKIIGERGKNSCTEKLDALLAQAEVIYGGSFPENLISRAPKLKWIQTVYAGVDNFMNEDIVKSPVMVTNMRGIHGPPVGELALAMMLMLAKRAPYCFEMKQKKQWQIFIPVLLRSQTLGIVGFGAIGREVARLAKSFGMRVLALDVRVVRSKYADVILPREKLTVLLSESDFVVLSLPLAHETDKMIGEQELRTMKPTACLINVCRGRVVDEEALLRALKEGWIAGAGLDAFTTEPLPADSQLWQLPNVIITPHVAGRMVNYMALVTEKFCENLSRYLVGERLLNVTNKKKGF